MLEPAQYLVADVGGTNTRIAFGCTDGLLRGETYKNDDVKDLVAMLREAVTDSARRDRALPFSLSPADGERGIRLTNRSLDILRAAITEALDLDEL